MSARTRIKGIVIIAVVAVSVMSGAALVWTSPAEAARCCRVMVCSNTPPYACWEECRTCPKFP